MKEKSQPKQGLTIFLIVSTMLLSLALFGCGVYSLYISIGFRFLTRSASINTNPLFTYSNSVYGTGAGTMVGLILISILMLALGVGMAVIFFKQLPLYKQIKLVAKLPTIKYKDYSKQVRKSVVVYSIIAYIICIAFAVFAIVVALQSGLAQNYLWAIVASYAAVLALSIASMVLMIAKVVQLSKIRKNFKETEQTEQQLQETPESEHHVEVIDLSAPAEPEISEQDSQTIDTVQPKAEIKTDKLFSDGIFELAEQLQKLREMHISGLISETEYTMLREKWLNAVLAAPLFGKKPSRRKRPPENTALSH